MGYAVFFGQITMRTAMESSRANGRRSRLTQIMTYAMTNVNVEFRRNFRFDFARNPARSNGGHTFGERGNGPLKRS